MRSATLGAENQSHHEETVTSREHLFRGIEPCVGRSPLALVFVSRLADAVNDDGDEADVERLRAEARILGVTLLVVAPDAVRCFESNDHFRCLKAPHEVDPRQLAMLFSEFGVATTDVRGESSVCGAFVLDPESELRFAFRVPSGTTAGPKTCNGALLRALVAASKAFERRRVGGIPFIEQTTRALVAGFEEAFGAARTSIKRWQPGLSLGTW